MTPYPHPHASYSDLSLVRNEVNDDVMIIERIDIELPADKLAALVVIARGCGSTSGWVQFRGAAHPDMLDTSQSIPLSTADWLVERGLLEPDEMAWHHTYLLTSRGKRVVELAQERKT